MTLEEQILEILKQETITDQKTLMEKLETLGHDIEQSTLSRILKRMNVRKHLGRYMASSFAPLSGATIPPQVLRDPLQVVPLPPNLLVVKTTSGFANALASLIDSQRIPGIAGSIAGDDTIFLAIEENLSCQDIAQQLITQLRNL